MSIYALFSGLKKKIEIGTFYNRFWMVLFSCDFLRMGIHTGKFCKKSHEGFYMGPIIKRLYKKTLYGFPALGKSVRDSTKIFT